jgi:hypothetical protein
MIINYDQVFKILDEGHVHEADLEKVRRSNRVAKRIGFKSKFKVVAGSYWTKLKTIQKGLSNEVYDEMWTENEYTEKIRKQDGIYVNDPFMPLWNVTSGLLFLDGGYGSSKTTYAITRLLVKAMENKKFKCYYGRQKKTEARELHDNIITEIERNGWESKFKYSKAPNGTPDILCIENGNLFKIFGCDDDESLKGIDNPTDILIDEINQIEFSSFGMLWTRLRTPGCELQLIGCFNNCDVFPDHWLRKFIYGDDKGDREEEIILLEALAKSNIIRHHSTYLDNKFQNPDNYYQKLVVKAGGNQEKIDAYCKGSWGVQLKSQPFYKNFDDKRTCRECIVDGRLGYNPSYKLLISFDENVNPYFPLLICQKVGQVLYIIDYIIGENPNNSITWITEEFHRKYPNHTAGIEIFGDATSRKEDVKLEKGKNFYTIASNNLAKYNPTIRVPILNPNVNMRGTFINLIFATGYQGIDIIINPRLTKMIDDLRFTQEDPMGKGKDKKKSKVNGQDGVQKWGHLTDAMDYIICELFSYEYNMFQNGVITHRVSGGGRMVVNSIETKIPESIPQNIAHKVNKIRYSRRVSTNGYR